MQKDPNDKYEEWLLEAISRLQQGEHVDSLKEHLMQQCEDIVLVTVILKEARNVHYAVLRKEGFRYILIGCIIGICGFLITLLNFNTSRSIDFAMYGLTTAGLLIVFWGLFKIIG